MTYIAYHIPGWRSVMMAKNNSSISITIKYAEKQHKTSKSVQKLYLSKTEGVPMACQS